MKIIKGFSYKKILSLFWKQDGSPYFKAKGVAFGVFSGCFPFFGFQTLLGVFLAQLFKANIVLAAIGTWISNPFTYIPLYFFNYKVGSVFLKDNQSLLNQQILIENQFWKQGWLFTSRLLLGSSLVGLFTGLIFGLISYFLFSKLKK
tara:strand:+ start:202 stop:642 length:441 start_codon:yes stop_codon:yes gene_type:complete